MDVFGVRARSSMDEVWVCCHAHTATRCRSWFSRLHQVHPSSRVLGDHVHRRRPFGAVIIFGLLAKHERQCKAGSTWRPGGSMTRAESSAIAVASIGVNETSPSRAHSQFDPVFQRHAHPGRGPVPAVCPGSGRCRACRQTAWLSHTAGRAQWVVRVRRPLARWLGRCSLAGSLLAARCRLRGFRANHPSLFFVNNHLKHQTKWRPRSTPTRSRCVVVSARSGNVGRMARARDVVVDIGEAVCKAGVAGRGWMAYRDLAEDER